VEAARGALCAGGTGRYTTFAGCGRSPFLGVAVAGIFGLLLVFILYPLVRVLTVSLFPTER